jgi:hypothetical protein
MSLRRVWLLVLLAATAISCAGAPVHFGNQAPVAHDPETGRELAVQGCGYQLMGFIPIRVNSRARRAYDLLVARAGDNVIGDIQSQERWFWAGGFWGTVFCTRLTATIYSPVE